jgi:arylsulfatase A-like enzyme
MQWLKYMAVLTALAWSASVATADSPRPNVLFIAIDDLNDWVSCLKGHPQAETPHIDRLAARGVLFSNAQCAAPACGPSRAALFTGRMPARTGVYLNGNSQYPAIGSLLTLTQHLMANGYRVEGAGKLFHGQAQLETHFHHYQPWGRDPRPGGKDLVKGTGNLEWGPLDVEEEGMDDHRAVDFAIARLRQQHTQPFFIGCGLVKPHLPWFAPRKYFNRFPLDSIRLPEVRADDLDDVPPIGRIMALGRTNSSMPGKPPAASALHKAMGKGDKWRRAVQAYLATTAYADYEVGRLLEALEASAYADNTVVVLWTDHGWHLGEKQHWKKFTLWEDGARTPLAMIVPGLTEAGGVCRQPASALDLYPTLVDLCGLPMPEGLDGISLRPWLQDPLHPRTRAALVTHGRDNYALCTERWRYIRYSDGREELYDHESDPHEWHNVAHLPEHAALKSDLAAQFPTRSVRPTPANKPKRQTKSQHR